MEATWNKVCEQIEVDKKVAEKWLVKLKEKYTGPNRHCHNLEMLDKKVPFLTDQPPRVVLAVFFQYFNYDARSGEIEGNCAAFKEFYDDAALQQVLIY